MNRRDSVLRSPLAVFAILGAVLVLSETAVAQQPCDRTVKADVVALDQAFYNNRLGSIQAGGMIFALRRDVISTEAPGGELKPGKVMLRTTKRPRPIVLRVDAGDCLQVSFQNLLGDFPEVFSANDGSQQYPVKVQPGSEYTPNQNSMIKQSTSPPSPPAAFDPLASQSATRLAGVHVMGLELVKAEAPTGPLAAVSADGSWVGANDAGAVNPQVRASGLVGPGEKIVYTFYAKAEGSYLLYSTAANVGDQLSLGGQLMQGLFGSVTVQPKTAEWYRSQVTKADLDLATDGHTADGHPIINYDKVYPPGHPRAGQPILKMLDSNNEIAYTDLTAIITGPNHGRFNCTDCSGGNCQNCPDFRNNPSFPDRLEPFREFAIHYHDDFVSTQAFEEFRKHSDPTQNDPMSYTLQGSRDFFAINYGMASIGPEIWSNRIGVGPMNQCATCRFEEFFLSSWTVGDPAMVVDYPANSVDPATGKIKTGPKATKALYPDDPSNVYHSYMGDHVRFQIVHAGTNISHVHHLHAQQWLHTPNDDKSSYRDSQMISPGGSYTLDHVFNGSGNKNKTVGDSIFHCHFYPHFAQGMWSLWRVHDVLEAGTELDNYGRPAPGWNRVQPDGEIAAGTPIPAVVPLPTLPMAPIGARVKIVPVTVSGSSNPVGYRADVNMADPNIANGPGYPFFIPGVAGQRAPHPPLDFAPDDTDAANPFLNGGLPRFQVLGEVGKLYEKHNRWDFTKLNDKLKAIELDEEGTDVEKIAMKYHATRFHDTFLPDGSAATGNQGFVLNGLPAIAGAPYADPAVELDGSSVCPDNKPPCLMRYKAADIQLDAVLNKKGQHYPQTRLITLWGDVKDTLGNKRAPEPFFFRANSKQVVEYWLANLVPNYYELDDFQVRTPTDILGQHIHLVKFDVTASDGAANGFNYEDGTLSPQEVQELIETINKGGGLFQSFALDPTTAKTLQAKTIPYFGPGPGNKWLGAQATVQRWYADPIFDNAGVDRTLRTIFTHDHFSPSTHQQAGLYAGLLVEPADSKWQDPVSGVFLGTNLNRPLGADGKSPDDGGPTGWQANINTADSKDSYREFALEFQDRQLAYKAISRTTFTPYAKYASPNPPCTAPAVPWGWADPGKAISPPLNNPGPCLFGPFPSIITLSFATGTYSVNYRNEPPAFRVNPNIGSPTPEQLDLSHVFRSIKRADPSLNVQPKTTDNISSSCAGPTCFKFPPPQVGAENYDPYTPILRAYQGDKVQIRTLVGAHMAPHFFTVHGTNWLFEPTQLDATDNTSGYRATQGMGISEHYEMLFQLPHTSPTDYQADYFYSPSSDVTGLQNGNWGIMRSYQILQPAEAPLVPLPNNQPPSNYASIPSGSPTCPADAPQRNYSVVAAFAREVLDGPVVYNARGRAGAGGGQQLVNWNALAYFLEDDLDPATGRLLPNKPVEPLILRANAGDCINITLKNRLPNIPLNVGGNSLGIPIDTSHEVGLHPQQVSFDVVRSNGVNVGKNPPMTVKPGQEGKLRWYAGKVDHTGGTTNYTPVEFGSIPLTPSDPLMQHPYGMIGSLVIEPKDASWRTDDNSRASAVVCKTGVDCANNDIMFREFVVMIQDDVSSLRESTEYTPYQAINIQGMILNGKPTWTMSGAPLPVTGVQINAGQTVNFDIPSGGGTHGLLFNDETSARAVFDIDGSPDKAKFQVFPSQCTIANSFGTSPQNGGHIATLTARQTITLQNLPFLCSQHCQNMTGAFSIASGDDVVITGDIVNGKPTWTLNGAALPTTGVPLTAGQTVRFEIANGTHGLLFNNEAAAKKVFDIDISPDKAKFQTFASKCSLQNPFGTAPQNGGHIATLVVKQAFALTSLSFLCSQHCQAMTGAFSIHLPSSIPAPAGYTRAVNYRTEPLDYRFAASDFLANLDIKSPLGVSRALSNSLVLADPETPVFSASKDMPVRFRMIHPAGINEQVFTLHGHVWQEEPFVNGSREIGNNPLSQSEGSRDGFGPNVSFDALIGKAGGSAEVTGDYLYRTFIGNVFQFGVWGLMRVGEPDKDIVCITRFSDPAKTDGKVLITGTNTVNPSTGHMADQVTIFDTTGGEMNEIGKADVDKMTGAWPKNGQPFVAAATVKSILVRSALNGEASARNYINEPGRVIPTQRRDLPDELGFFNAIPKRNDMLIEAAGKQAAQAHWEKNGLPVPNNGTITIRPGDTITITVKSGRHDLTFLNGDEAKQVFKFEMPGSPFAQKKTVAQQAISTGPLEQGTILATLTVRKDIPATLTRLRFRSAIDRQRMNVTFVIEK